MGNGLWVMGYGLWVMGNGLWVMGYGLWGFLELVGNFRARCTRLITAFSPPNPKLKHSIATAKAVKT